VIRLALCSALGALALGCASLPHLHVPNLSLREAHPRVQTADGLLSPAQSAALIERQDKSDEPTLLERQVTAMKAISEKPWVAGNRVELLVDGPASYRVIFREIARAHRNVNIESYIVEGEQVGERLSRLLVRKQSQGVQVNLLYDAVGSLGTSSGFFERLRAAGVHVCEFNPLVPNHGRIGDPNQRDHRKQVIVDGRVAISGGINISDVYSSGSAGHREDPPSTKTGWRDTNIEVRGPAVAQYQELFLDSWRKQSCQPLDESEYLPKLRTAGDKIVTVVGSSSDERRRMYLALLAAIRESRQNVFVTMAYFVPDAKIRRALENAARRGVDVELLLPGFSDSWVVLEAGRSYYSELLEAGVHIREVRGALLHAKTAVVDDVWSTVGSTNLDLRSLLYNDELNTIVLGEDFGRATTALFEEDLQQAALVDPLTWRRRGPAPRAKELVARMVAPWL
jgi:cardiolipin synthase A/B